MKSKLVTLLVASLAFSGTVLAGAIVVPNGSFEEVYKPGSTTVTADIAGSWTNGVGWTVGDPAPMHKGTTVVSYSDGTEGTLVDIPGWVNAPADIWPQAYPDWADGSGSGSVAAQNAGTPDGTHYFSANGPSWGVPHSGACESESVLAIGEADMSYTISAYFNGPITPIVLDLLADDVVVPYSSTVDPGTYAWTEVTRTYDVGTIADGAELKIRVGWGPEASGNQSHVDMVTMTAVPEPATMALLGMGGLALIRRRRR